MRPVSKPASPPRLASGSVHDLLMDAIGSYCSYCERRLTDTSRAWHAGRGRFVASPASAADWPDLLLLCEDCAGAAHAAPGTVGPLLRPDRDRTFGLGPDSPFTYNCQPVQLLFLGEDGRPDAGPETVERVIVAAATPAAQATIDAFALNTPYYDRAENALRIPRADHLAMVDRRVDLRTEAWAEASRLGAEIRDDPEPSLRRFLSLQAVQMVQAGGYWSTWATALWRALPDRDLMVRLLMPPHPAPHLAAPHLAALQTAPPQTPPPSAGDAHRFPGTRGDWLP